MTAWPEPATWGCARGNGLPGMAIRAAELRMSRSARFPQGDAEASGYGHCVVFVGDHDFGNGPEPAIAQAEWPRVVLTPAKDRADVIYATGQPLTQAQRTAGLAKVFSLVGDHYDPMVYAWYLAKVAGVTLTRDLTPLFTDPKWVICSGLVVLEQEAMRVDIGPLRTAATQNPDFVCPADCMRWGLDNGWFKGLKGR